MVHGELPLSRPALTAFSHVIVESDHQARLGFSGEPCSLTRNVSWALLFYDFMIQRLATIGRWDYSLSRTRFSSRAYGRLFSSPPRDNVIVLWTHVHGFDWLNLHRAVWPFWRD